MRPGAEIALPQLTPSSLGREIIRTSILSKLRSPEEETGEAGGKEEKTLQPSGINPSLQVSLPLGRCGDRQVSVASPMFPLGVKGGQSGG
jgi:hypothetical protein